MSYGRHELSTTTLRGGVRAVRLVPREGQDAA